MAEGSSTAPSEGALVLVEFDADFPTGSKSRLLAAFPTRLDTETLNRRPCQNSERAIPSIYVGCVLHIPHYLFQILITTLADLPVHRKPLCKS